MGTQRRGTKALEDARIQSSISGLCRPGCRSHIVVLIPQGTGIIPFEQDGFFYRHGDMLNMVDFRKGRSQGFQPRTGTRGRQRIKIPASFFDLELSSRSALITALVFVPFLHELRATATLFGVFAQQYDACTGVERCQPQETM